MLSEYRATDCLNYKNIVHIRLYLLLISILLSILLLLPLIASAQAVIIVDQTSPACTAGSAYYTTIQAAVDAAASGDTIIVCSGTYNENVDITKSLTVKSFSQNPSDTVVQVVNTNERVFYITANSVNISGFTIKGATNYTNSWPWPAGIYIDKASGTTISNNIVIQNFVGILSSQGYPFSNTTIIDNTITSNVNKGIFLHRANYATISNNNIISNGDNGLATWYLSNSIIERNNISSDEIAVSYSNFNNITENIISNGYIWLHEASNNLIAYNTINRSIEGYSIQLTDSSNHNTILNNTINSGNGIALITGNNNAPSNNTIKNNLVINSYYGVVLSDNGYANKPKDNKIYHNNFIGNTIQARDTGTNKWNDGYKGGNYWSDWTSPDNLSGIYQNENGSDGIVDDPYNITNIYPPTIVTNKDRYPFVKPYGWLDWGVNLSISSRTPRVNTTTTIPINLNTTIPVGSAQLYLHYNPSVINATNVTAGSSSTGVIFSSKINNTEGKITIAVVSVTGISNGSIADIEFQVVGSVYSNTPLELVSEGVTDIKNIELNTILQNGNLTVISYPVGDVTGDDEITVADALMYLRSAVGEAVDNTNPLHDVTCDGKVTAADALLVLRKAVGQEVSMEC